MRITYNIFLFIFLSLISFSLQSCNFDEIKSVSTMGTATVTVDDNVEPLMLAEQKDFERINPESKLELTFVPSKNTVAELVNNQTRTIVLMRNFNQEERTIINDNKIEIDSSLIAYDALAIIVNPSNPILRLTSDEVSKIFSGQIEKWNEINSPIKEQNEEVKSKMKDAKIKLYIPRKNNYLYEYTKDSVMKGTEYSQFATMCSTNVQMINEIRNNQNAIGISNLCWLSIGNQDELDSTIKAVKLSKLYENGLQGDYMELHQGLIFKGSYPYRLPVFIMTTIKDISLITGLRTFLTTAPGQQVVLRHGLVPVTQPVRTIQLN
ncbi:MAG TPA: substrate-binding domain-containing protein [Ignavibacteria bacterium]|nr:substrate-binding domain-containing protein [Ignavibacteria bacterium]